MRVGLIERAGQGMDLMFSESIRQGKPPPGFTGTDDHQVVLTLYGTVRDPALIRFVQRVEAETQAGLSVHDLILLDRIVREEPVPEALRSRLPRLLELGVVERIGRGRGVRYLPSRRFYSAVGRPGGYTRRRGLDRGSNKMLLLEHLRSAGTRGASRSELHEVVPGISSSMLKRLLDELRQEGSVVLVGERRWARWYDAAAAPRVDNES